MKTLSIIKKKLCSMRYSKKEVQKETSRDAKQFIYGYTECINDLLEYINAGGDGLPEHELFAEQSQSKKPEKLPVCKYCGLKESTAMEMIKEVFEPIQLGENEVVNQALELASKKAGKETKEIKCTCGNPSGEGLCHFENDEKLIYHCADCGSPVHS